MKKLNLMAIALCGAFGTLSAQSVSRINKATLPAEAHGITRCASTEYEAYLQQKNPRRMTEEQFEAWLKPLIEKYKENASKSQNGTIITIPVVVHVIHSGQNLGVAPNITDSQVLSQITIMNNDYRRAVGTPGYNTNSVGADVEIQFELAKVDPNGNPTNGVDRINLCQDFWNMDDIDTTVKPSTIWDPTKYMNMWSVQFADASLLGYATFPAASTLAGISASDMGTATTDGVVANFSTFGNSDYNDGTFIMSAPYDKGRTMTHEVGHFLGLRHIWGDNSLCTVDATDSKKDYCLDTPAAKAANYTCNTAADSCPSSPGTDMVQNYMDYTPDACMNIFTQNQKTRIRTVMDNATRRASLKASTTNVAIPLFANDADLKFEGSCAVSPGCGQGKLNFLLYNRGTSALTSATISYSINNGAAQTYNWTGNLSQDKFSKISIPVSSTTASGTVTANIVSANGGTDQRATNNTTTGTYTQPAVPEYFATTTVSFKLQPDAWGSETIWTLKNSAGTIVKAGGPYTDAQTALGTVVNQTWTLPQDCYVFTISDAYGDGMSDPTDGYVELKAADGQVIFSATGNFGSYATKAFTTTQILATSEATPKNQLSIYPNPATDFINVKNFDRNATYKIMDVSGRLVSQGDMKDDKISVANLVKGNYILILKSNDKEQNVKFIKK